MLRLFIAIDLPDDLRTRLAEMCSGLPGAHWVPAGQLHLTLRFIGEVEEKQFIAIKKALAAVKAGTFDLKLDGVGHFPPGRRARVLWVGLTDSVQLLELQRKIETALVEAGIEPDERAFSPHITLARLKEPLYEKVAGFESRHGKFESDPFPVDAFYLYSSTLSPKGAVHRREAAYPVGPSAGS